LPGEERPRTIRGATLEAEPATGRPRPSRRACAVRVACCPSGLVGAVLLSTAGRPRPTLLAPGRCQARLAPLPGRTAAVLSLGLLALVLADQCPVGAGPPRGHQLAEQLPASLAPRRGAWLAACLPACRPRLFARPPVLVQRRVATWRCCRRRVSCAARSSRARVTLMPAASAPPLQHTVRGPPILEGANE